MPDRLHVAVAGAHTAAGLEIVRVLDEREFPSRAVTSLVPEGVESDGNGEGVPRFTPLAPEAFQGVDLAFFAGDARLSRSFVPAALEAGAYVVDLSSAHRSDPAVPLCVPPIAPFVRSERRIAACPDPLAAAVARAVAPLKEGTHLECIEVTSLHSVSTRGSAAVRELELQIAALMNARAAEPKVFKHRVAFNAFPQVGQPEKGSFGDEIGLERELPRILDLKDVRVGVTCIRVPIFFGNAAAILCQGDSSMDAQALRGQLSGVSGIKVLDDPAEYVFPTTQLAVGDDAVLAGRIRPNGAHPGGIAMFIAYDAIRLAAVNAVAVAEAIASG